MVDSANRELTVDVFKVLFVLRTIRKRCLNSEQMTLEFFGSNR